MGSAPAFAACPSYPTGSVYAYVCSVTANFEDGFAITYSDNTTFVTIGAGGPNSIKTKGGSALQSGRFKAIGAPGQLSSKEYESTSNPSGSSGTQQSAAGLGDAVHAISTIIPFAAGNPRVTQLRLEKNAVLPTLHVTASGTTSSTPDSAVTVQSAADADFSDILSLGQNEVDAAAKIVGHAISSVYVSFTYTVHGNVKASPLNQSSPAFGDGEADFGLSLQDLNNPSIVSSNEGSAEMGPVVQNDDLTGESFTVSGRIAPGDLLQLTGFLGAEGSAVGAYGINGSYNVNLSDTAEFDGVAFYEDAGLTEQLPDMELSSEFGFDYVPSDAILSPVTAAVPEASTWAMLLAGFGGLGVVGYLRSRNSAVV
jgi:hypothetical protein